MKIAKRKNKMVPLPNDKVALLGVFQVLGNAVARGFNVNEALEKLDDDSRVVALALSHRIAIAFGLELHISKSVAPDSPRGVNILSAIEELDRKRDILAQIQVELPPVVSADAN
ncbi:hypothetical protein FRC0326_00660 [Corynebacterium diphtheriae]|nr:hypothetical protein FRC0326_00660 [Corynebacterium diphtheriae]